MAWDGYYVYNGSEILNVERVETYLAAARVPWFRPQYQTTAISDMTGEVYINSWVDDPPWGDPDNPDTYKFWGAYPLNITGVSDSTRTAAVTENVGDGGSIGNLRAASRSMVFEVALMGESECAVEAGFNWLKSALSDGPCGGGGDCNGADLCYFSCEPCVTEGCAGSTESANACLDQYSRTLRNVKVISGPTITAKRKASDESSIWTATFTAVAGVPFEFGPETPLVEGFGVATTPWVPDVVPIDWAFDDTPNVVIDEDCALPIYQPVVDPLCPAVEAPPAPPSIPIGCFTAPDTWDRRWFTLPRKYVPYWGQVVPVISVQTGPTEARALRLRFYADLDANASILEDPCGYCGDILISYIPPNSTLHFDGVTQTVVVEGAGGIQQRADSLVYKTDGTPFEWPVLSCGLGYVVAVDFPSDQSGFVMPAIDLSLVPRGGI